MKLLFCDNYILIYFPDAARANVDAKRIKLDGDEVDELAISVRYNQLFVLLAKCFSLDKDKGNL